MSPTPFYFERRDLELSTHFVSSLSVDLFECYILSTKFCALVPPKTTSVQDQARMPTESSGSVLWPRAVFVSKTYCAKSMRGIFFSYRHFRIPGKFVQNSRVFMCSKFLNISQGPGSAFRARWSNLFLGLTFVVCSTSSVPCIKPQHRL